MTLPPSPAPKPVGIIGCDLGVTTGLAWGLFSPNLRDRTSLWNALAKGRKVGCAEIGDKRIKGLDDKTALLVCHAVMDRIAEWNMFSSLGTGDVLVIIEDFQIRRNLIGGTGKDKLAPVYLAGMLSGVLHGSGWGRTVRFVAPATSMRLATDARLKMWAGMTKPPGRSGWVRGKNHARDAWRLVAAGLNNAP